MILRHTWSPKWKPLQSFGFPTASITKNYAKSAPSTPFWTPSTALDEWVQRDARPISLRQLTFFGRTLTESRLLSSANYVRTELPTRLAHRLRDMQTLPYVVVTNEHLSHVYELYYRAFESFRKVPEIRTIEDNEKFCAVVKENLKEHLTVIPRLAIGVLEAQESMDPGSLDKFVTTLLRSRISRRVIAEQHLALTDTFQEPWHYPGAKVQHDAEFIGDIFLRCDAKEVVENCSKVTRDLMQRTHGTDCELPQILITGHHTVTFPYILSHLEYIIGELLRNSIQAVIEQRRSIVCLVEPIEVLICETSQHVIIRISDKGGGIPPEILPHLWSFSKGPRRTTRLRNLHQIPTMAATMQEVQPSSESAHESGERGAAQNAKLSSWTLDRNSRATESQESSLASLTTRRPDLKLGVGLPMSKIYAEYWAGSLEIHSLEGYGVDAFLQIPKLGNKNEQLTTRASMDAV